MIRLALRVRRADAELVLAELLELAPGGVEETELPSHGGGEGVVEYAVYGSPGELPDLPALRAAAAGALVEVSTSEIPDDWSERWKRFHRPVLIEPPPPPPPPSSSPPRRAAAGALGSAVPALHVRPPWEAPSERFGAVEIVVDPAQAFGTGAHATTRMCLELLLELATADAARGAVLDVGAGSGVLAIAAARLGYRPVIALDNDRESVRAIVDNAAVNGVDVEARLFDLRGEALPSLTGLGEGMGGAPPRRPAHGEPDGPAGDDPRRLVLANLLRPLLLDLAASIERPPPHLIASGLLREEADEVARAFAGRLRLRERARRERDEWAALWLSRD